MLNKLLTINSTEIIIIKQIILITLHMNTCTLLYPDGGGYYIINGYNYNFIKQFVYCHSYIIELFIIYNAQSKK